MKKAGEEEEEEEEIVELMEKNRCPQGMTVLRTEG